MKLKEIVDQIIRSPDGGIVSQDSKFVENWRAIEAKVPIWSQRAYDIIWNGTPRVNGVLDAMGGNKFLSGSNYIPTSLTYNANIQVAGADFIVFQLESEPVRLDPISNGFIFVGDQKSGRGFTQLKYPSTYYTDKDADLISPNEVYYNVTGTLMNVWGNTQLRTVYLDYIAANPLLISTFNQVTDEYPASADVLNVVFALSRAELYPESVRAADYRQDATPIIEKQANAV